MSSCQVLDIDDTAISGVLFILLLGSLFLCALLLLCQHFALGDDVEHLIDALLLEDVIFFDELLVKPIRMFDSGYGVGDSLQGGRDRDDLGDGSAETLDVVVPIKDTEAVE